MRRAALWPAVFLLAQAVQAQTLALEFDAAQTKVEFTLPDVLHTVHGTFKLKRGGIQIDAATGAVSGEMVVDATSGDSGSAARDRRMHANILESIRYPEIVFRPDRLQGTIPKQGAASLEMHGMFRIHGGDHEITLPVNVEAANGKYSAKLQFVLPYVEWGMKNPSTFLLRVSDKVTITVQTVAKPAGL